MAGVSLLRMSQAMTLTLVPLTRSQARRYVGLHHRHNLPPVGDVIRVGVEQDNALVGVAMAGRPTARRLDDGTTLECYRVCTTGTPNACSMLYGALSRAAFALGYKRVITYTLASEPGTSLRAVGWRRDAELEPSRGWNQPSRPRAEVDLFGHERTPMGAKVRWVREMSA